VIDKDQECREHAYFVLGKPFRKLKPGAVIDEDPLRMLDAYEPGVTYLTICCRRCGRTREVVASDHSSGSFQIDG
jgi:hypothetical protein